ncbi:hypothetical protein NQ314_016941 [Rhamnusium bicolor]|uniref:Arginine kinase n=1 Tax=Rhamnusium bicolor TaxID=1586634 RepID=A0AAV8WUZ5_9CUCU|nr:hypothetical protein NQ314_016941 [Rhamnusium bicolor]
MPGKEDIAEYIVNEYPNSVNITDNDGRTPLHYAALLKDNGRMTNFLIEHGADESALDSKQKTAAYYKTRNSELDSKLLNIVPECPRSAKESFAANFDWTMLTSSLPINGIKDAVKKVDSLFANTTDNNNKEDTNKNKENGEEKVNSNEEATSNEESNNKEETNKNEMNSQEESDKEDNNNEENSEEETVKDENNEKKVNDPEKDKQEVKNDTDELRSDKIVENGNNNELDDDNETETNNDNIDPNDPEDEERIESNSNVEDSPSKSRPTSAISPKTRPNSEAAIKSRPNSQAANNSRPNSQISNQSRPNSETIESRPSSRVKVNTRPNSKMIETDENQNENHKTPEPVIEGEGVIEGVVNGEDEIETLNNEGQNQRKGSAESEEDVRALVEAGNMEQLAALVLSGDGEKLVGQSSDNPELQSFLENVPVYMDSISPKGASPLHVAVMFGNTSIVRYLAGRFPETVQVIDENGRTPLHYAAVLADNGHYYNLLVHLGADARIEDKCPRTLFSARKDLDEEDMITVLERCYTVLHGRRNSNVSASSIATITSITSSSPILTKHVKRYVFDKVKFRLTKLDHNLYDIIWPSVKKLPTDTSFRIALEQDFPLGLIAPDFYVYKVFKEFLEPIIKDYNCIDLHNELQMHPKSKFADDENKEVDIDLDLDPQLKWIISGTLDATRNLSGFELPKSLNHGQLELVERIITTVLLSKEVAKALYPLATDDEIDEKGSGTYYTMNEVLEDPSEARVILASNGLLIPLWNIPDSDRLHGRFWPYGRGVFISNGANLAVWINVLDHIRIVTCTSHSHTGNVGQIYSRIARLVAVLDKNLQFKFDDRLGYLSARPSVLGNTLQFILTLRFPYLIKEPDNLRHLCVVRGLTYYRNTHTTDVVRIGNQQCLGITELQCFEDFTTAVVNILQLERDLAMSNSLHIAALFLNIFRKKNNVTPENSQVDMPFFATEEGRYLASSLGDPLIKGLTEVANKRPEDPIAYLAQYLYNFANNRNNIKSRGRTQENQQLVTGSPIRGDDNNAVPANIDVVTIEPDESNTQEDSAFNDTSRDEHGQSMLHFAAARAHGRNALFQLLLETEINVAYRDELYRTARDISIQANLPENTEEIDRYVLHIATKGDTDKLVELLLDGYDHITDIIDEEEVPIIEAVSNADQTDTVSFLQSILAFEEKRERVHHAIRQGSIKDVTILLADENDTGSGKLLAIGKNSYGRCTLHIAVLCQQEEIVDYLANTFPDTLKLGDNLERTALHYSMGVDKMETISRVLIKAGAKRVTKDLKGRQPTYYFLNKSDILRLQEEEETF